MNSALFKSLGMASGLDGLNAEDPVPPGGEKLPLYVPKDTRRLKIQDLRKLNPATGQPWKGDAPMSASVNPDVIDFVIKQAMNKGVDPNTALAIALQETKLGNLNEDVGSAWATLPDQGIENPYEQGANSMVKALADKLDYAKRLGYDKKGEAFALQAYNGYGKLMPRGVGAGVPTTEYYYGIPTTRSNPLNMATNPVYGKTVMSVRDEIIKKHPEIQKAIQKAMASRKTVPMQSPALAYTPK